MLCSHRSPSMYDAMYNSYGICVYIYIYIYIYMCVAVQMYKYMYVQKYISTNV